MWATTYFTSLCLHVPLWKPFYILNHQSWSLVQEFMPKTNTPSNIISWTKPIFRRSVCVLSGFRGVVATFDYRKKYSEVFDLEGNGSIVGIVGSNNASSVSHLVAGGVQLTHLSQAGWQKEKKSYGTSLASYERITSNIMFQNKTFPGVCF